MQMDVSKIGGGILKVENEKDEILKKEGSEQQGPGSNPGLGPTTSNSR